MEIRQIIIDNHIYDYQLHIKKIKSCCLKVVSGKIVVSTSPRFSIEMIEKLILEHKDAILKQINSYVSKYEYRDGGYVYIFNRKYNICLKDIGILKAVIHENDINVYHYQIQMVVEMELKNVLYDYLFMRIKYYIENLFDLEMPEIEIKKLKSRWGACFPKQNKVSFNLVLVHLDKELIDYVIIHELCHFIWLNHSKQFYHEIEKRLPDYKVREQRLKEIGI